MYFLVYFFPVYSAFIYSPHSLSVLTPTLTLNTIKSRLAANALFRVVYCLSNFWCLRDVKEVRKSMGNVIVVGLLPSCRLGGTATFSICSRCTEYCTTSASLRYHTPNSGVPKHENCTFPALFLVFPGIFVCSCGISRGTRGEWK